MRLPLAVLSCFLCLATLATAQTTPDRAVIATRLIGVPTTQLLDVDLVTGGVTPFGPFPSDGLPPLAVAVDPVNRDLLVALDAGGSTRLLRLTRQGHAILSERLLAQLNGRVSGLALARSGSIELTIDGPAGAVVEVPRNGGSARIIASLPHASAVHVPDFAFAFGWVVQSGTAGPPSMDPELAMLDFDTGSVLFGPGTLSGVPLGITGVVDLPTGLPRAVVSTDAGTLWVVSPMVPSTPQLITPQLPPGATVALESPSYFEVVALGGSAHPFLKTTTVFSGAAAWQILAGPFPGDPVDFALTTRAANVVTFGESCPGPLPYLGQGVGGAPQLGNTAFGLAFSGQPSSPVVFVLGSSDQHYLTLPLPAPLPVAGGCVLHTAHEVAMAGLTDSSGRTVLSLPIPGQLSLAGAIVFAQAFQVGASALTASPGVAVQIEP